MVQRQDYITFKMPDYKSHIVFSFFFVYIALLLLSSAGYYQFTFESLKLIPFVIFFSILPDVDIRSSKAFKYTLKILLIIIISLLILYLIYGNIALIYYVLIISLLLLGTLFLKHRGKIHTFLFSLIITVPLLVFGFYVFFVAFLSYISHLILDGEFKVF